MTRVRVVTAQAALPHRQTMSSIATLPIAAAHRGFPHPDGAESDPRVTPRRPLRPLWLGLLLSVVIHTLLVWFLPKPAEKMDGPAASGQGPLQVTMSPPRADTAPPVASDAATLAVPPPRVMAAQKPSTVMPPVWVAPEPPEQVVRKTEPLDERNDFMAMLNARRAQRQAAEDFFAKQNADARSGEREMSDAEKAEAAFRRNTQSLGRGQDGTSGVFQIQSKGTRFAAFSFRGWTTDRERSKYELIEVDAGAGGDVEEAIVRKMITLIRQHYQANFNWDSRRLGRVVVLSARLEDNGGLEAFLLREFF